MISTALVIQISSVNIVKKRGYSRVSVFGHRAKSQKPPIPLISAIVSFHPFNLAEAKPSVRLHPNKPENLPSIRQKQVPI